MSRVEQRELDQLLHDVNDAVVAGGGSCRLAVEFRKALATEDSLEIVNIRIQRPSTRSGFTVLKAREPPLTCITASVSALGRTHGAEGERNPDRSAPS